LTGVLIPSSNQIVKLYQRLARDDSGATAVEYGLIIGGIAALVIVVVYALGVKVNNLYAKVNW
jgi:pilus assembly protein Flp/PilA